MKSIRTAISLLVLIIAISCNDSESDLLQPKLYFENTEMNIEIEDTDSCDVNILSRVSNKLLHTVNVEYSIGDKSLVEAYNKRNGTEYAAIDANNYLLEKTGSAITSGEIYSAPNKLSLKKLSEIKEGMTLLLPIVLKSKEAPVLDGSDLMYVVVKKPFIIDQVVKFFGQYLDIQLPASTKNMTSVTYEALININSHVSLSTIMGNEGVLIFRFGDTTIESSQIQIAGNVQFNPTKKFDLNKWYHVAFVYDASSQKAGIYVNGTKEIDKVVGPKTFDLNKRFCIGYAYDYDVSRVWRGHMSECRIWTVARSEKQIKNNMLGVDPNSDGLLGYWKLNGTDIYEKDKKFYVKDQSKNGLDALSRKGHRGEKGDKPGPSVKPNVEKKRVKL